MANQGDCVLEIPGSEPAASEVVTVRVEIAQAALTSETARPLKAVTIVPLDEPPELVDVCAGGRPIARGSLAVRNGCYCVCVREIIRVRGCLGGEDL